MSLETVITRAWQRQAPWLWLLLPISWLYGLVIKLRQHAYKLGIFHSYRPPVAVMVIGNISVGGSGKTPLIISLVAHLQQHGIKVGVISRGYGGDSSKMPLLVDAHSLPSDVGDEPCLIVNETRVPMAVCANRQQAINTLLTTYPKLQLIIADDGLQHYALQRDIEWIVVDVARGFGNQQLLPTGFLREPIARLKDATVVYHEEAVHDQDRDITTDQRLTMHLQPDKLQPLMPELKLNNMVPLKGAQVHAVSGIGYPQRFFNTLTTLGFTVIAHPYPDHYDFDLQELLQYDQHSIIVTSKDAVKIRALLSQGHHKQKMDSDYLELTARFWVLPVTAILSDTCYQKLHCQLADLRIVSKK